MTAKAKRNRRAKAASAGRPAFEVTDAHRSTVMLDKAAGFRDEKIAEHIGCDPKTLRKHFRRELDNGKADAMAMIRKKSLIEAITGNNPVPRFYWMNNAEQLGVVGASLLPPPPALGIRFDDGGPGRPNNREPFGIENPETSAPASASTLVPPAPVVLSEKEFAAIEPATPAPPVSATLRQWEVLGMSPEQFAQHTGTAVEQDWGAAWAASRRLGR